MLGDQVLNVTQPGGSWGEGMRGQGQALLKGTLLAGSARGLEGARGRGPGESALGAEYGEWIVWGGAGVRWVQGGGGGFAMALVTKKASNSTVSTIYECNQVDSHKIPRMGFNH